MGNNIFDGQILAEKLLKLNNSQQSIESLSRLCISHRKRAKEIVETWDKLFSSSQKGQRISFLYLANDILQNSRRKGSEFVNEFWKVLPAALRRVYDCDEHGKKVVTRLIDIWEDRKVFGSRGQGLKDEIMGKNSLPSSTSNGKSSNPIKIVKRDAHSVRLKLAVGCLPEKILTSLHSVHDEHLNEEAALNKCNTVVHRVGKLVEEAENTLAQGNQLGSTLVNYLQEQENELKQYIVQLENAEASRAILLSQLKDALQEQESRQELVHTQLLAAQGQIEQAASIRKRFTQAPEATRALDQNLLSVQPNSTPLQPSFTQPSISFTSLQTTEEDKKAAAAAVAAKLAASTSSALMLTSVLSSLVAEEAASMNGSLNSTGFTSGFSVFNPEKKPKLEKQLPVSEGNSSDMGSSSFFGTLQQPSVANVPLTQPTGLKPISQPNQSQAAFASGPPPPHSPVNPPANQYVQSTGLIVGGIPYGNGSNNLPPPPPLPPHVAIGLSMPNTQPSQSQAQQAQQQQPSSTGGFYRPPGIGFYGQSHSSTQPAPVPRQ
ncbi:Regulation of nuclear pre-mRNA domain-containing protein 1B [Spatholobus suberectus]|nr:Regulation of nuclear pre-mRNA domain-containing protein 1B [Spatholobus suberectus]